MKQLHKKNNYVVVEKIDPDKNNGKKYVLRAAQYTLKGALRYTGENRILMHYETYLALYRDETSSSYPTGLEQEKLITLVKS